MRFTHDRTVITDLPRSVEHDYILHCNMLLR